MEVIKPPGASGRQKIPTGQKPSPFWTLFKKYKRPLLLFGLILLIGIPLYFGPYRILAVRHQFKILLNDTRLSEVMAQTGASDHLDLKLAIMNSNCFSARATIRSVIPSIYEANSARFFEMAFHEHTNALRKILSGPPKKSYYHEHHQPKFPLCVALLETAECGRCDWLLEELDLLDKTHEQVEAYIGTHHLPPNNALTLTRNILPDNAFIVNILRLAASKQKGPEGQALFRRIDEECKETGMTTNLIPIATLEWTYHPGRLQLLIRRKLPNLETPHNLEALAWPGLKQINEKSMQTNLISKLRSLESDYLERKMGSLSKQAVP